MSTRSGDWKSASVPGFSTGPAPGNETTAATAAGVRDVAAAELETALTKAAFLCIYSRLDSARPNRPIMVGTNPFGELLLGSGAMPIFDAIGRVVGLETLVPVLNLLPMGMVGVDVNEELHRFDVRGAVPDERKAYGRQTPSARRWERSR